jgi:hypothetical protein
MRARVGLIVGIVGGLLLTASGCSKAGESAGQADTPKSATASGPCPTILLAQAQFIETIDPETGKTKSTPGPARLEILRDVGGEWISEVIEDPESNVFHKAIIFNDPQNADAPPDASKTLIKRYRFEDGEYVGDVVCTLPDHLCRFLNVGDVDGDGKPELIASTHKQGIWLARPRDGDWPVELVDADSGGFEHATVLADLDSDGVQEIYVAADDQHEVRRYRWNGTKLVRETLHAIDGRKITFGITAGEM